MTRAPVCAECEPRLDDVLARLRTRRGVSVAQWLWSPAAGAEGHALVGRGTVVVHTDTGTEGIAVRAHPGALPLRSRSVAALVVPPVLPELPDLDGLFAELRRVLRPHGLVTMVVPDGPPLGLRGRRLRSEVRAHWVHRSAVDHPEWLLTAADFAVLGDDRVGFRAPVADAAEYVGTLCAAGLLPTALPADVRARLAAHPSVRSGRVSVRRLVARR